MPAPPQTPRPGLPTALRAWLDRRRRLPRDARLYLIGAALMGLGHGATWVHLNLFYKAAGLDEHAIGTLLAVTSIGGTVVALPAAALVERWPTGRVLAVAALGFTVSLLAQIIVPDLPAPGLHLPLWTLASVAFGVLFAVHHVAAAPFFMRVAPPDLRPDLFGLAQAVETAATLFAALLVGWLARGVGDAVGSEMRGLQVGLAVAALTTLPAYFVLRRIESAPAPPAQAPGTRRGWFAPLRVSDKGLVARLMLPTTLVGLGAGLIIPFLNLYFRDRFHLDPGEIGTVFAVGQVLTTFAFLAGPALARRVGTVAAIVGTELLSIPFFLVLAFSTTLPFALVAFWMRSALMQMNQPISSAFALELVPEREQAAVNSVRHVAWNLSWAVSTQLGGLWIAASGHTPPMLATVCLYVLASLTFWGFFGRGRTRGRPRGRPDP
ncbi:MFS transporter [Myxococcota bacterium]|nr:MFS transporter [Myxococcota bacterium]